MFDRWPLLNFDAVIFKIDVQIRQEEPDGFAKSSEVEIR